MHYAILTSPDSHKTLGDIRRFWSKESWVRLMYADAARFVRYWLPVSPWHDFMSLICISWFSVTWGVIMEWVACKQSTFALLHASSQLLPYFALSLSSSKSRVNCHSFGLIYLLLSSILVKAQKPKMVAYSSKTDTHITKHSMWEVLLNGLTWHHWLVRRATRTSSVAAALLARMFYNQSFLRTISLVPNFTHPSMAPWPP